MCGICAFVVCPLVAVAGLITGMRARRQIRESNGAEDGDGLALAGLIVSGLGLLYMVAMIAFFTIFLSAVSRLPTTPSDPYPTFPPAPTSSTTTTFG